MYNGKDCEGLLLKFTPNNLFMPYRFGIKLALAIRKYHPNIFKKSFSSQAQSMFIKATGTDELLRAFMENKSDDEIISISQNGLDNFISLRKKYLLYE